MIKTERAIKPINKKSSERKRRTEPRDDGFHEMMPNAYMNAPTLFPTLEDHQIEEPSDEQIKKRMLRQLIVLFGLLILQFILFAVLIQSTVNLG